MLRLLGIASTICLLSTQPRLQAAIIFLGDNVTTTSDPAAITTGRLDLYLTYDNSPAGLQAKSYNLSVALDPSAAGKIRFTSASLISTPPTNSSGTPARNPLLPPSTSPVMQFGQGQTLPGLAIRASVDATTSNPIFTNAALVSLNYEILPGASGTFPFSFVNGENGLQNNTTVALSGFTSGSITITAAAVPEPTLCLLLPAAGALLLLRRRSRNRSA